MTNKEIKKNARMKLGESFRGDKSVFFAFAFRVALTIVGIISLIVSYYQLKNQILGVINPIIVIIGLIINLQIPFIPFNYSFDRKALKMANSSNDNDYNYGDFFYYYSNKPLSVIILELIKDLFLFFWAFTIVGIFIKMFSYSMASFVKIENPDLSATESITESRRIINGYKFDYFCLHMSFIGWYLLSILTLGAIYPFVRVYIKMCEVEFYNYLKNVDDDISLEDSEKQDENEVFNKLNANSELVYANLENNSLKNKNALFVLTILLSIVSFVGLNYISNTMSRNYYNQLASIDVISYNSILDKFILHIKGNGYDFNQFQITLRLY